MELLDLYDERHQPTGETQRRDDPVPDGRYRLTVHVLIFNAAGQLLIQQRHPDKKNWGGLWDLSVGGGVLAGETSQEGARRETLEELGLDVDFSRMAPAVSTTFTGGFDDLYVVNLEPDLSELRLETDSVHAVRWADRAEVLEMIQDGRFIPFQKDLISYLFFRADHRGNFDTDRA